MAEIVRMPKLSDTMTEGVVAQWHKKVGDKVKSGDLLADIETDKATMEFESFQDGVLLYIGVEKGKAAPIDGILAVLGKEGEDISSILKAESTPAPVADVVAPKADAVKADAVKVEAPKEAVADPKVIIPAANNVSNSNDDGRIKASPLAKRIAYEKGIDISNFSGTGDNGRVVKKDIESYNPAIHAGGLSQTAVAQVATVAGQESYTEETVSQMRKVIAKRLAESLFTAPHFYLTLDIDMDEAMKARIALNEKSEVKISFNDMVIKASAMALRNHPKINASWLGDKIRYNQHVHIGVAIAVEDGLLVPVVRFADHKGLSNISSEVKDLGKKAKEKKLQPADWEGNTFTISNLGMFGIEEFTAIINPPDACILAVGGIKQVPVVKNGEVVPGNVMKVTLSCDHRVVDGATGAAFLQNLKQNLEQPFMMLL
jgi:pyruvate dehydrogenase E2 component (dihydrolipoamide acetyltransferase)